MTLALSFGPGFMFGDPWFLTLLAPLAALVAWRLVRRRRGLSAAADGAPGPLLADLPATWRTASAALPAVCLVLGAAALVCALARPLAGRDESRIRTQGLDILLVVDVSSSMLRDTLQRGVTSLDVVKAVMARFVESRTEDRLGLISFASWPRTVAPLTLDGAALLERLAEVQCVRPNTEEDGTAIGVALGQAARRLRDSDAASKVVILLTDGEHNRHEITPEEATALCQDLGIRVYTIFAGPGAQESFGRRLPAVSTALLERIAQATGGRFFHARDAGALDAVYAEIDRLERSEREDLRYTAWDERYPWLLLPATLLLALGWFCERGTHLEFCT